LRRKENLITNFEKQISASPQLDDDNEFYVVINFIFFFPITDELIDCLKRRCHGDRGHMPSVACHGPGVQHEPVWQTAVDPKTVSIR